MLLARTQGDDLASETRDSIVLCWISQLLEDTKLLVFSSEKSEQRDLQAWRCFGRASLAVLVLWLCIAGHAGVRVRVKELDRAAGQAGAKAGGRGMLIRFCAGSSQNAAQ